MIGKTTLGNLQSGMYYGYAGLVQNLIHKIQKELGKKATVVATGGMAQMMAEETGDIQIVDGTLTLKGLRLIWERNQDNARGGN